jgi:hypothetical protein
MLADRGAGVLTLSRGTGFEIHPQSVAAVWKWNKMENL